MLKSIFYISIIFSFLIYCNNFDNPIRSNKYDPKSEEYIGPFLEKANVVNESKLQVLDIFGEEIKELQFNCKILEPVIYDIDKDELKEVIIGTYGTGSDAGKIYLIDNRGVIEHTYNSKILDPYNAPKGENYFIVEFLIDDILKDGDAYIVVYCKRWYLVSESSFYS